MKKETRKLIISLHKKGVNVSEMRDHDDTFKNMPESTIHFVVSNHELINEKRATISDLNKKLDEVRREAKQSKESLIKEKQEHAESLNKLSSERGKWLRKIKRLEATK